MAGKFHHWRLDFNKQGQLPEDFTPHGAAAVVRARDGRLRLPIWDGYQLHGDVGERLGLTRKHSQADFIALCATPGAETHVAADNIYDCAGKKNKESRHAVKKICHVQAIGIQC